MLAALQRDGRGWRVLAVRKQSTGTVRDYTPMLATIATLQDRYAHRRRRFWLVRLRALLAEGRVATRARCAREAQLLERLLDETPDEVFRRLVLFL